MTASSQQDALEDVVLLSSDGGEEVVWRTSGWVDPAVFVLCLPRERGCPLIHDARDEGPVRHYKARFDVNVHPSSKPVLCVPPDVSAVRCVGQ